VRTDSPPFSQHLRPKHLFNDAPALTAATIGIAFAQNQDNIHPSIKQAREIT